MNDAQASYAEAVAIRTGDAKGIERSLAKLRKAHADEWAAIECAYGRRP